MFVREGVHVPRAFFKVDLLLIHVYRRLIYKIYKFSEKSIRNTRLNTCTTIKKGTRQIICLHRYLFDTWYETSACGLHAFFRVRDNAALKN